MDAMSISPAICESLFFRLPPILIFVQGQVCDCRISEVTLHWIGTHGFHHELFLFYQAIGPPSSILLTLPIFVRRSKHNGQYKSYCYVGFTVYLGMTT